MAPPGKNWIFVSDAHFTGHEFEEVGTFLRFLDSERDRMDQLVILGDLFEFFFGFKNSFSQRDPSPFTDYLPILKKLQELHGLGIRIRYCEGNHDFFLQTFFSDEFGMAIDVYPESCDLRLEGKRTFIAHGDLSNPGQWKYRAFRRILKNRWTYGLIHMAGPRLSKRIARKLSNMSYQKYHDRQSTHPPAAFKTFAHQKFAEGFDLVILGHSHFPEEVEEWIGDRRCLYFNVGAWKNDRSFLRFTPPDHFELTRYAGE